MPDYFVIAIQNPNGSWKAVSDSNGQLTIYNDWLDAKAVLEPMVTARTDGAIGAILEAIAITAHTVSPVATTLLGATVVTSTST